jgi:nitroimidazol reductase NimA-like FMN-containing flavoprotein (pyridoxamine 5'-phosphate oxidase superfamily)
MTMNTYTTGHWFKGHLRDMPRKECFEALASQQVGRVVFIDPDGPLALPVNYVIHDESVLIAISPESGLSHHLVGQQVAFEVDEIDEFNETGWSVLVRGQAAELTGESARAKQGPNPWADGDRSMVIRISPTQVSGRYLVPA